MTLRILTSFHYFRDVDMAGLVDELRTAYGGPMEVFADSGAFSAATTGAPVRLTDYAAWLAHWDGLFTVAATLDVIGDHKATARNTAALEEAGHSVLPTFHVGTPWPVLEDLCTRYQYIALGGMVPHSANPNAVMRWLVRAFRIARETGTVFHGFGQTTHETVSALPFYSVDSSTWSADFRFGDLTVWDESRRRLIKVPMGDPAAARTHTLWLRSHGLDPAAVGQPGFARRAHRDKSRYDAEYASAFGASAAAWQRHGDWLQRRHHVTPPPGHTTPGTVLYLAEGSADNLKTAAAHLGRTRQAVAA